MKFFKHLDKYHDKRLGTTDLVNADRSDNDTVDLVNTVWETPELVQKHSKCSNFNRSKASWSTRYALMSRKTLKKSVRLNCDRQGARKKRGH